MNLDNLKQYFIYTRSQRLGLAVFISLITILQILYLVADFTPDNNNSPERQKWLAAQIKIDSLKIQKVANEAKKYPFNPNFITDFKGYRLGMSVAEIDRLHAFRKTNNYVNSAAEFQRVTQISDSLLHSMAPLFKFPHWVNRSSSGYYKPNRVVVGLKDINLATKEDLMAVYGIGPALSERILKQRQLLGCFVSMEQMQDIWGLSPEVIIKLGKAFDIQSEAVPTKISLNTASLKELASFPYFGYRIAKEIITFRSMNGDFAEVEDLAKINDFPVEKIKIIKLYLKI